MKLQVYESSFEFDARSFMLRARQDSELKEDLINQTPFLPSTASLSERAYCYFKHITPPLCPHCGKPLQWSGRINKGYNSTCGDDNCLKVFLSQKKLNSNSISEARKNAFLEKVKRVRVLNDRTIKRLIEYDYEIELIERQDILDYLDNRYSDSGSRLETVQRIRKNVEEKPKCPVCGKPVVWVGKKNKMFTQYCCNKCRANCEKTHEKAKQTMKKKWGAESCYDSDKMKEKMREKYGVDYTWQREDVKEKRQKTLIEHYGTTKLYQVPEIKRKTEETNMAKFGYVTPMMSDEVKKKHHDSCKQNNKCGTSKEEDNVYEWLLELGYKVERFVRHDVFPFNVDFYISEHDLYIEYQGSQYHNGRAYLGTADDLKDLESLKQKNIEIIKDMGRKKSQYQSIIDTWTIFDVKKRNYAKEHNIRYLEIYSCHNVEELKKQIDLYLNCLCNQPLYNYPDEILQNEFMYYKNLVCNDLSLNNVSHRNIIIKQFQHQNFFKHEIDSFVNDPVLRRKLIQNRIHYLNKNENDLTADDILTGFKKSGIYYGYSHFNPMWTNWFVHKFGIKTIYDPCGGWGHHLLGMLSCEKIVYNDLSVSTVRGVQKIKDYFSIENLTIHLGDATQYVPEDVDAWFMCPPYYNIEHYECGDFSSIDDYIMFLNDIMVLWQQSTAKLFGVILREDMIKYIYNKYSTCYDLNIKKSHLQSNKKLNENFYIFRK